MSIHTKDFHIKLAPALHAAAQQVAYRKGLTLAAFVRLLLAEHPQVAERLLREELEASHG